VSDLYEDWTAALDDLAGCWLAVVAAAMIAGALAVVVIRWGWAPLLIGLTAAATAWSIYRHERKPDASGRRRTPFR
jgi:fatty acid desaturase